jgi:transposase-like protein
MPPVNRNKPKRAKSSDSDYSIFELAADFPDDRTCLDWLWRHLYSEDGQHAECPKCERARRFHRVASRPSYSCDTCGHHVHPTAGTIFHKSSTSLALWFRAIYLMSSTRCGISAKQLEREIGVTYKTAWRMFKQIRTLLQPDDDDPPLNGEVEVDETFYGGKPRLSDGIKDRQSGKKWADANMQVIFGMVERGGRVRAIVVPNRTKATLMPHMRAFVLPASVIYSDEHHLYGGVGREFAGHRRIKHRAKVYVDGDVHTQTIEGLWALVKTGILGVHHSVSAKYLQGYVDEYAWRYNHRHSARALFHLMIEKVARAETPSPGLVGA